MPRSRLEWIAFAVCLAGVVALVLIDVLPRHHGASTSAVATTVAQTTATTSSAAPGPRTKAKPRRVPTRTTGQVAAASFKRPTLVLSATRGDCWVSVRLGSRTGASLYEQVLRRGATVRFTRGPLWIRLGAAGNLDATLNGKRIAAFPNGTVQILVGAEGISPAR